MFNLLIKLMQKHIYEKT